MGPLGPPEVLQQLGPIWDRVKGPLVALLVFLLLAIAFLAWIALR